MSLTNSLRLACIAAFGLLPTACAPQARPAAMSGMSGTAAMSTHDMAGMDMQAMMDHCARMRQDAAQGRQPAPDMRTMMAQCDRMDRGMTTGAPAQAPAATLSR